MNSRQAWSADPLRMWLRETRNARRISLSTAARLTGVTAVALGAYERGDRTPPPHVLRRIALAYGFNLAVIPIIAPVPARTVDTLRRLADEIEQAQVAA